MSKSVDNITCNFCESLYKLSYTLDDTSGHPKFCPFCSEETYSADEEFGCEENQIEYE